MYHRKQGDIMHATISNLMQFATEDTKQATFKGSTYRKQLAKYGEWVNPDYPFFSDNPIMTLDEAWGESIVKNFNDNTLGTTVPVPANHSNDVEANRGRVLSVESIPGDGLYGELEILEDKTIQDLDKGIIFDVSISFEWDHVRTDDNKHYGATLLHVALVNNPYLIGMKGFEKIEASLSKSLNPNSMSLAGNNVIMLSRNKMKELSAMGTETNLSEDVEEVTPEQPVEPTEEVVEEETTETTEEVTEEESPEEDEATELSRIRLENSELKLSKAFDDLLHDGKVIPAQKDKIMALAKLSQGVELSTDGGKKIDLATVVLDILRTNTQQFSTDESGSSKEYETVTEEDQTEDGKKPSEVLSEAEAAGFKAVGADPQTMDELAEKFPEFREALASLSK